MSTIYADSSALVKLVYQEDESAALASWLTHGAGEGDTVHVVSSSLVFVEVMRAARKRGVNTPERARRTLQTLSLVSLNRTILQQAATVSPMGLRSLDAIHLATALSLEGKVDYVVTYDIRLRKAAEEYGLSVVAPA